MGGDGSTCSTRTTILYLEDQVFVREAVVELLSSGNCTVIGCATIAEARHILTTTHIDLLISDVNLPDGSGLDLIKELSVHQPLLPIIVCSGHDLGKNAFLLGQNLHILEKPFEIHALEILIAQVTSS